MIFIYFILLKTTKIFQNYVYFYLNKNKIKIKMFEI